MTSTFCSNLSLLRASPIVKLLRVWTSVKWEMLEVRYQGGNGTNQRRINVKLKHAWKLIGLGPTKQEYQLYTFQGDLHKVAQHLDPKLVTTVPCGVQQGAM